MPRAGDLLHGGAMNNCDPLKLVIVDDSEHVHDALIREIAKLEHIHLAGQAFDVPQALARIRETAADLVILDMNMPGGNGLDVLKAFSVQAAAPVCIVFSFHLTGIVKDCCLRLGARTCLRKPEDVETLVSALAAIRRSDLAALRAGTLLFENLGSVISDAPETPEEK